MIFTRALLNAEHLNNGIALAAYYAQEAIRLAGASCIAAPLRLAQELLNWLRQRNKELYVVARHLPARPLRHP